MRSYSEFFNTLYDEVEGCAHYSVLRALVWVPQMRFHDFAVVWDEFHDPRIIWVVEQLYVRLLLHNVLFIGERKTQVTVLTPESVGIEFEVGLREICGKIPSYCSQLSVVSYGIGDGGIINDSREQVAYYLNSIDALWSLGTKDPVFRSSSAPHRPTQ
jgi:hypothetical protein